MSVIRMSSFFHEKTGHSVYICKSIFNMKSTDLIQDKINKLPKGYVFTYRQFINEVDLGFEAIVKYLNRLTEVNRISKLFEREILQT